MSKFIQIIFLAALGLSLFACRPPGRTVGYNELRNGFTDLPDSIQTTVYWHWLSGNISKEGVVADLESMKAAGINRAFIANIGLQPYEVPTGDVRFLSDEWWEILHAALKKAAELDIEIGIFNSAGWSQAGGEWVRPEQSMRRLTSVRARLSGGQAVRLPLPKPSPDFQDVRVLAYPSLKAKDVTLHPATEVRFTQSDVSLDFRTDTAVTLRSLRCHPLPVPVFAQAVLSVKGESGYEKVKSFRIDRRRDRLDVGFEPYAPVSVSFPATTGKEFRLEFTGLNPGCGFQEITLSSLPVVENFEEKTFAKMFQEPLPYWKEYQWPVQAEADDASLSVHACQVTDISAFLQGDTLLWDAPQGEWEIVRTGMLPTYVTNSPALEGDGLGLEVDKMSKTHLQAHFDAFIGEIYRRIPAEDRKTWKVVVADSYEVGGQNFTDDFLVSFEHKYGYSAIPFLPVYEGTVVESQDASDRFLWDMRKLVAEQLSYNHVGELTRLSHQYGLATWLENYGHWGFMGEFLQYGGQADEVAGEFWSEGDLGNVENRAASSCAHIYGKQKVSSESFTCGGNAYSRYPELMKQRGDLFFSEGVNNSLLHVYISQKPEYRRPGLNTWYGNEFNRNNTWYSHLDLFTDYLKRCNFMLQQGLNVADVCYFIGEDTPKMTGIMQPALPKGYQFDYINAEVILRDMTVKDGLLTLPHGTSYRMMVLPPQKTMRPELLEKLKELVANGGIILGPRPERSPSYQNYPDADRMLRKTADLMWGDADGVKKQCRQFGKGLVFDGMDMEEVLSAIHCIPDCVLDEELPVVYCHRRMKETDIYFIANQSSEKIVFSPSFRISGRQPELWNPVDGSVRTLPIYEDDGETTTVPLELEQLESAFIVFAVPSMSAENETMKYSSNYLALRTVTELSGPWTLTFDPAQRGPASPIVADRLFDWSKSDIEQIRHYSGEVIYQTDFVLPDALSSPLFINLGNVMVMAKVKVNGKEAGGVWTAPYRIDISDYVHAGVNNIEVSVVNTWMNRLVGDCALAPEDRLTWSPCNPWNAFSQLQSSGLVGPVVIEEIDY